MATDVNLEQAREFFLQGVQHFQAGRFAEAERSFLASLALVPGRPSTLTNLGAVRLKLGQPNEALAVLDEALAQEPDAVDTLGLRATALAELGLHREALAAFDRALEAAPSNAQAWTLRGSVLVEMKRFEEAAGSYRQALALGGDPEVNRYYLAAAEGGAPPPTAPRYYVQGLFDNYAASFDTQLVQGLKYQAPKILADRLAKMNRRFANALDLGCGTGLCGRIAKKALMDRLEGVDLSMNMLEVAAESGVYDQLVQADIHEYLRACRQQFDLVIAADVFIYVGALDAVFEQLARCMPAGGVFCFSVEEAGEGEGLALRPSRRYAHSERYVRDLAAQHGFEAVDVQRAPIREDDRKPLPGIYFWLARSA